MEFRESKPLFRGRRVEFRESKPLFRGRRVEFRESKPLYSAEGEWDSTKVSLYSAKEEWNSTKLLKRMPRKFSRHPFVSNLNFLGVFIAPHHRVQAFHHKQFSRLHK